MKFLDTSLTASAKGSCFHIDLLHCYCLMTVPTIKCEMWLQEVMDFEAESIFSLLLRMFIFRQNQKQDYTHFTFMRRYCDGIYSWEDNVKNIRFQENIWILIKEKKSYQNLDAFGRSGQALLATKDWMWIRMNL